MGEVRASLGKCLSPKLGVLKLNSVSNHKSLLTRPQHKHQCPQVYASLPSSRNPFNFWLDLQYWVSSFINLQSFITSITNFQEIKGKIAIPLVSFFCHLSCSSLGLCNESWSKWRMSLGSDWFSCYFCDIWDFHTFNGNFLDFVPYKCLQSFLLKYHGECLFTFVHQIHPSQSCFLDEQSHIFLLATKLGKM